MVPSTVAEPLETVEVTVDETVHPTVQEPFETVLIDHMDDEAQQDETIDEEATKKEMIRQAMSELGKRSAAARARRRSNG